MEFQRYGASDTIKIRNGIIFNLYTGLPHVILNQSSTWFTHMVCMTVDPCYIAMCVWYIHCPIYLLGPYTRTQLNCFLLSCHHPCKLMYQPPPLFHVGAWERGYINGMLSRSWLQLCIFFTSRNEATTVHSYHLEMHSAPLIALTSFSLFQELCDWEAASSSDQDRQPLLRNCQVRPLDPYHWLYCYLPNNSHRQWTWPIICGIEWNAIIVLSSVTVLGRMLTCRMCVYSVFGFAYCLRFVLMFMKPN